MSVTLLLAACAPHAGTTRATLHDVDWYNRSYDVAGPGMTPQPRAFVGGGFDNHRGTDDDREVFRIGSTWFVDVTRDGVDEAVVELIRDQSVFGTPSLVHLVVFSGDREQQTVIGFLYVGDCRCSGVRRVGDVLEVAGGQTGVDGTACDGPGWSQQWRWDGATMIER